MEKINQLNKEFGNLVGLKPVSSFIINNDTGEIRFYNCKSSIYKKPKGWTNTYCGVFKEPIHIDFTSPTNFQKLINVQWRIFNSLGPKYERIKDEPFEVAYLNSKIAAIKIAKSFGGGEMLNAYIDEVARTDFVYDKAMEDSLRCYLQYNSKK